MDKIWIIAKRELKSFFDSLTAYIMLVAFLGFSGFFTWLYGSDVFFVKQASLQSFFSIAYWTLFFFIPALTMTLIRTLGNRITMLGLAQDVAHSTMSKEPQALVLRARESTYTCLSRLLRPTFHEETRRTYRAILSEPRLVIPGVQPQTTPQPPQEAPAGLVDAPTSGTKRPFDEMGDAQSKSPTKTETRPNKKRKNKQR